MWQIATACSEWGANLDLTAFVNALVFDGSGSPSFRGHVIADGSKIVDVLECAESLPEQYASAQIVDCEGCTLLPGLTEAHCHISFNNIQSMHTVVAIQPEDHVLIALSNAQMLARRGFTSLFGAASAKPRLDVAVRDAVQQKLFEGPRIRAASQEISPSGNLGDLDSNYLTLPRSLRFTVTADGAEEFRRAARFAARDGVDNIKVNVSGDRDWGHMHADDTITVISKDELQAVVDVAAARGLVVATHCTSSSGVKMCVETGVEVIYHALHADSEARDMLEAAKDRIYVAPAVGLPVSMFRRHEEFGLDFSQAKIDSLERELEITANCMSDLRRRGVRVLPGGDYGAFITNPMGENARDLELFVEMFGFSPADALAAATSQGAQLMRLGDVTGQIRPGFDADLVVVDGDPLEDISLFQKPDNIRVVTIAGRFVTGNRTTELRGTNNMCAIHDRTWQS